MTWLIAIDESGDLGTDSRYFTMAAVINGRVKNLDPVFRSLPKGRNEPKFSNSGKEEICSVLNSLADTNSAIVTLTADKQDDTSEYHRVYGNSLYLMMLQDLIDDCFRLVGAHDTTVFLDRSSFVSMSQLTGICRKYSANYDTNVRRCVKAPSYQNRYVQIADFVAGAVQKRYEHDDDTYFRIIEKKSVARRR